MTSCEVTHAEIESGPLTILVEPTREKYGYACSPGDVIHLLSRLLASDTSGLSLVVFRQPTRKQELLDWVWGRCLYHADFGRFSGPAIMLEAHDFPALWRYPRALSMELREEVERLRVDGHSVSQDRRGYVLRIDKEAARNTVLYRTLLHEIGHWVHWKEQVTIPAAGHDPSLEHRLIDEYFARPSRELEWFAHKYATQKAEELRLCGIVPFQPKE